MRLKKHAVHTFPLGQVARERVTLTQSPGPRTPGAPESRGECALGPGSTSRGDARFLLADELLGDADTDGQGAASEDPD